MACWRLLVLAIVFISIDQGKARFEQNIVKLMVLVGEKRMLHYVCGPYKENVYFDLIIIGYIKVWV